MAEVVLVLDNIRSALNVGAIARTAEGLGVKRIFTLGLTPYPAISGDTRLPHVAERAERQIAKTALGAEKLLDWQPATGFKTLLPGLKKQGFKVVALEQDKRAKPINTWRADEHKIAFVVGHETKGVDKDLLDACDSIVYLPMSGKKESFNVASATAMALFYLNLK